MYTYVYVRHEITNNFAFIIDSSCSITKVMIFKIYSLYIVNSFRLFIHRILIEEKYNKTRILRILHICTYIM